MNGDGRFYRLLVVLTALSGASVIMLGAWGAHWLDSPQQHVFDTALRYQAWHTLALVAVLMPMTDARWQRLRSVCGLWWLGMVLFSGSLYVMVLTGWRVGWVTPCGGLLLMAGWLWLARQWWCLIGDRRTAA
ncbi:DUF423 domain-containing protein [Zymobacter sp. IVIA_12111.31 C1]|uniref:DUF423 domain-containing protein n=1 Tax=Zymobacter sp. IVIA_12111.31 C1 TaxID=3394854 RepID=UPI0039C0E232